MNKDTAIEILKSEMLDDIECAYSEEPENSIGEKYYEKQMQAIDIILSELTKTCEHAESNPQNWSQENHFKTGCGHKIRTGLNCLDYKEYHGDWCSYCGGKIEVKHEND